jgi:hypothetical protein
MLGATLRDRPRVSRKRMNSQDQCTGWRAEFEQERAAATADATLTLTAEHERELARRQQIEAHNDEVLADELLEESRRRAALEGMTDYERAKEQMRGSISI